MAASSENESEILLGNKQLLAVFAAVAILLAIAFTGGYMLGKTSAQKKAGAGETSTAAASEPGGGPITQNVAPEDTQAPKTEPPVETAKTEPEPVTAPPPIETAPKPQPTPPAHHSTVDSDEVVLGAKPSIGAPKAGQTFVQVMAVTRKEAEATADVLRKHKFPARIAPAPGSTDKFRVLVGPTKDPVDLRNTEDALRKVGYTNCFPQRY